MDYVTRFGMNEYYVRETDLFFSDFYTNHEQPIVYKRNIEYFNLPISFDIETSSWYWNIADNEHKKDLRKCSTMYIWQFSLDGVCLYGRTWQQFINFLRELSNRLELNENRRVLIYVHNLAYEFQFIRKYFKWKSVFLIKNRRPVRALTTNGIEFRCSLFLSAASLADTAKDLVDYKILKLEGDIDYSLVRHSGTPLTRKELNYCFNDVRCVTAYIQTQIDQYEGDITKIPLTNTGRVREYCRERCFYQGYKDERDRAKSFAQYHDITKSLIIKDSDEFKQAVRAFMGGFTHASPLHAAKLLTNVESYDISSSYPYTFLLPIFPMSSATYIGTVIDEDEFENYMKNYCCIFDVVFKDINLNLEYETPISLSRCKIEGKYNSYNGRIVSADLLATTMCEYDFDTAKKFYTWSDYTITNLRIYRRGYLPKPLILAVLNLYRDKTELKGVSGKEAEYMILKAMLNAVFGMAVTNPVRDEILYSDDEYFVRKIKDESEINYLMDVYNNDMSRFLYYIWGIYITAYARHRLLSMVKNLEDDYVYSDTDSVKFLHMNKEKEQMFTLENNIVKQNLLQACTYLDIPYSMTHPKNIKGKECYIGTWDKEPGYYYFKTLGAKRYMFVSRDTNSLSLTVAGLNKKFAVPYLISRFQNHLEPIFDYFNDQFYIPPQASGKMSLTYLDRPTHGLCTDYLGNTQEWSEESSVFMEPSGFSMSIAQELVDYLSGIQYEEY